MTKKNSLQLLNNIILDLEHQLGLTPGQSFSTSSSTSKISNNNKSPKKEQPPCSSDQQEDITKLDVRVGKIGIK